LFCFSSARVQTQDFTYANQALYYERHPTSVYDILKAAENISKLESKLLPLCENNCCIYQLACLDD
jgi:hypothetical protein